MPVPTQPEPAEGARSDDASAKTAEGNGPGASAEEPAEGSDDAPGAERGSPRG